MADLSRIMTTPTAGQVGGQESGTSSTSRPPVPSVQRTMGGRPSSGRRARHEVQTLLWLRTESPAASAHKKRERDHLYWYTKLV